MLNPPLLKNLAYDPILSKVKLIAEAWDAGGLYQVGSFPSWNRWSEWNGKYRDDIRCFLKGDSGKAEDAAKRIMGSTDLYNPLFRGNNATVNFITCHDGFTLYDLYSYNHKHNEANGWNNADGDNGCTSWNCGAEGETDDMEVNNLRMRLVKNAFAVLMCSRGAIMFFAGDEFCNTQFGNNNAYCQDNIVSWLDWDRMKKYSEITDFTAFMIDFRKKHDIIRHDTLPCSLGFPMMSIHNSTAWNSSFADYTRTIGIMFAGKNSCGDDDIVFLAINAYWESQSVELPHLPSGLYWYVELNTNFIYSAETDYNSFTPKDGDFITLYPRSVVVCTVRKSD
jgi:glycogen operon protein